MEKVRAVWSHAWSANYAALEFLPDTGLSRFSPVKPQRWLTASFEHQTSPHGLPRPHIHNIVAVALIKRGIAAGGEAACSCRRNGLGLFPFAREWSSSGAESAGPVVDDIDGSAADGMVRFGLDGTDYEIDLNTGHAQALRDALAPYISAARRAGNGAQRQVRNGRKAPANGVNTTEIREWAKAQGIEVKDRGRVPAELVVKFKAATAG